jgi:hypothetical protein
MFQNPVIGDSINQKIDTDKLESKISPPELEKSSHMIYQKTEIKEELNILFSKRGSVKL